MAKKSFRCKVVTPTAALVDDAVTYASIPAWDGLIGILPGRAPLLAKLGLGELRLDLADSDKGQGQSKSFFVEGGFVKMSDNQLIVLAEKATPTESLSLSAAEAELKAAQAMTLEGTSAERNSQQEKRTLDRERARVKIHLAKTRGNAK